MHTTPAKHAILDHMVETGHYDGSDADPRRVLDDNEATPDHTDDVFEFVSEFAADAEIESPEAQAAFEPQDDIERAVLAILGSDEYQAWHTDNIG